MTTLSTTGTRARLPVPQRARLAAVLSLLLLLLLLGLVRDAGSQCDAGAGCPVINEDCRGRRSTDCEPCDLGATFSPGGDQGQCSRVSACPEGEGVLAAASNSTDTRCEPCSAAVNFSASASATLPCLPTGGCGYGWGRAADLTAAANISCAACPAGKYSDETSQRPCVDCDANNEAVQEGSSNCVCTPGYYRNATGLCAACDAERYKEMGGDQACGACPDGTIGGGTGLVDDCMCPPGSSGLASTGCRLCPAGRYTAGYLWGAQNPGTGAICEGDCDTDAECNAGLVCFDRSANEAVPGCGGGGVSEWDYCSMCDFYCFSTVLRLFAADLGPFCRTVRRPSPPASPAAISASRAASLTRSGCPGRAAALNARPGSTPSTHRFVLKLMDFILEIMDFVLKKDGFYTNNDELLCKIGAVQLLLTARVRWRHRLRQWNDRSIAVRVPGRPAPGAAAQPDRPPEQRPG